jgi:hypothetical protein
MSNTDCSLCPSCCLVKWLKEEHISNFEDEDFMRTGFTFKFNIPIKTWKSNEFTKNKINIALKSMPYKVGNIAIKYNRTVQSYIIQVEIGGD